MTAPPRRRRRLATPRTHRISIRLSETEWESARALASQNRLSVGAWIAETLADAPGDHPQPGGDRAALRSALVELNQARTQLAKAGGLLNQAVAALNTGVVERLRLEAAASFVIGRVRTLDEHVEAVMKALR